MAFDTPPTSRFKHQDDGIPGSRSRWSRHTMRLVLIICSVFLILAVALGVGLGVGLTQRGSDSGSQPSDQLPPSTNNSNATSGTFWQPAAGTTWQIELDNGSSLNTSVNVSVYDIDLFDTPSTTISLLKSQNRRVICYFSAGSFENWRPEAAQFLPSDKGGAMKNWPGERWLNTNSTNVRNIMSARLALAKSKGCDGVDPDNIDAYDNKENGLGLTTNDSVNYLTFLAIGAHSLNMSIGLKNGGAIVPAVLDMMQWEVNEQCVQFDECDLFRPFIDNNKPVFHIEYPEQAPNITGDTKSTICDDKSADGFSTLLKEMDLDNWVDYCS